MSDYLIGTQREIFERNTILTMFVLKNLSEVQADKFLNDNWCKPLSKKIKWLNHAIVLGQEEPLE